MSLDPGVPILRIETIEGRRQNALQRERLLAAASVAIGWVALALSAIGLFGRVNRDVVARTREIVIRSALGATPFQIAKLFLKDTARILVVSGVFGDRRRLCCRSCHEGSDVWRQRRRSDHVRWRRGCTGLGCDHRDDAAAPAGMESRRIDTSASCLSFVAVARRPPQTRVRQLISCLMDVD